MKFPRRRRVPVELNLTPLIDVVFLLLLFFMVSTTFDVRRALDLTLPVAETGGAVDAAPVVLDISADGDYRLNGTPVTTDAQALQRALAGEREAARSRGLVIEADGRTAHQRVVTAMDVAGRLGINHIRISTRPGDDSR